MKRKGKNKGKVSHKTKDKAEIKNKAHMNNWKKLQEKGKQNYIWKDNVIRIGIPFGALWAFFNQILTGNQEIKHFISRPFLIKLIIGIIIFACAAYLQAYLRWRKYEKKFSQE